MREPSSDTRGAARKSPCLLARSLHKHASERIDGLERPTCKGFKHFVKIPHSQARAGALQEPTSTDQRASTSSTNPPQISSSKWPLILGRSTMQASRFVKADSGSSKGPMVMCRLDGEAIGSLPSELMDAWETACNVYVTASNFWELKRSFLGVVFDVESDSCLKKGIRGH